MIRGSDAPRLRPRLSRGPLHIRRILVISLEESSQDSVPFRLAGLFRVRRLLIRPPLSRLRPRSLSIRQRGWRRIVLKRRLQSCFHQSLPLPCQSPSVPFEPATWDQRLSRSCISTGIFDTLANPLEPPGAPLLERRGPML